MGHDSNSRSFLGVHLHESVKAEEWLVRKPSSDLKELELSSPILELNSGFASGAQERERERPN